LSPATEEDPCINAVFTQSIENHIHTRLQTRLAGYYKIQNKENQTPKRLFHPLSSFNNLKKRKHIKYIKTLAS